MSKVFIIAEAGVNHNGDLKLAKALIDAAADCRADAIKFQTFKAQSIISRWAPKADYQKRTTKKSESQLEMVRKLELDRGTHVELIAHCRKRGITFLSSPFDLESIDLLKDLGLKIFKVPSGEIVNLPYLRKLGGLKKKVLLSTGMADLREIKEALRILVEAGTPRSHITVLHCHTEYPTAFEDANLNAIMTLAKTLKVNVGYSDHTPGIAMAIAAVALGAQIIEKHFTLDCTLPGPDHQASLEPPAFGAMVAGIRQVEQGLGNGIKKPTRRELKNKWIARKSLVASVSIKRGEAFTEKNMTTKRPGTGLSPMLWDKVIGRESPRDFEADELIALK